MSKPNKSQFNPPPIPPPVELESSLSVGGPTSNSDFSSNNEQFNIQPNALPKTLRKNLPPPSTTNIPNPIYNGINNGDPNLYRNIPTNTYPGGSNYYQMLNSMYNNNIAPHNRNFNNMGYWNGAYPRRNIPHLTYDPQMHGIISQLAEEKTRSTFGSIETILNAFSSINMILDSTYSAIHGSFRTLTGVADHLIFVRNHLAEMALFPRVIQIIVNFFRWLLKIFGLNETKLMRMLNSKSGEQAWNEALSQQNLSGTNSSIEDLLHQNPSGQHSSSLTPIFVFFSLVLGAPYIIWRLLGAPGSIPETNLPEWTLKSGRHFVAIGLYDFKARTKNELSFQKNQMLFIKPESVKPGTKWLIACTTNQTKTPQIGFIPLNYVKLVMK